MSNSSTSQKIGPRRVRGPVGEPNGRAEAGDQFQAECSAAQLRRANAELSQRVAELQRANAEIRDVRRAALNVMEDAVHALVGGHDE